MRRYLFGIAALVTATTASASITPVLTSATSIGGGEFAFTYSATLASDQAIFSGSYFTLYDIFGFTGFSAVPVNWTTSSALIGLTPDKTLPDDDAGITNVTFTYTGPTLNFNGPLSERELGLFTITSTSGVTVFDDYTSQAILNNGPRKGSIVQTVGESAVGVPGIVPEPTTWATMILGLGFVGVSLRRRTARSVAA